MRAEDAEFTLKKVRSVPGFAAWERRKVHPHRLPGHSAVTLALRKTGAPLQRLRRAAP